MLLVIKKIIIEHLARGYLCFDGKIKTSPSKRLSQMILKSPQIGKYTNGKVKIHKWEDLRDIFFPQHLDKNQSFSLSLQYETTKYHNSTHHTFASFYL